MAGRIVILGAGGLAREITWSLERQGKLQIEGFIDENSQNHGKLVSNYPVLGDFTWFDRLAPPERDEIRLICAVGSSRVKAHFARQAARRNLNFYTLRDPSAQVGGKVRLGEGTAISAGCVLSCDIIVGRHVFINMNAIVGHDTVIEDYCFVAPLVSILGGTHLEEGVEVGANSVIFPGVRIGSGTKVSAGSLVNKSVPPGVVVAGAPARVIAQV